MPTPGQLPPVPPNFTGRSSELAALNGLLTDADSGQPVTLAVIMGAGGAGKTSLALRWLHGVRERFPAGQLYAELGGHAADAAARPPDVLGWFLRSVGVAPERVPLGLAEAAALWRSVTTRQRLVILLDNAVSAGQVRAVLPGPGPSLVAVTTRWRLGGLAIDGARFTELGPLDDNDAVELLGRILGPGRVSAEPEASNAVVRLCGGLPLAVCVSAARLAPNPRWRVGRIAAELASERHRLAALTLGQDLSVRAAFDVSYAALPAQAARAYRLLSLIPSPDFGLSLAAAALAAAPAEITGLLDALTGASLLEETPADRFRFHDLVRLHAREHAAEAETDTERHAVISRSVDWYLASAVAADLVVIRDRWQLGGLYDRARLGQPAFASPAQALGWLESELPGLLAAVDTAHSKGLHEQAWQLCEALWGLFVYRRHFRQWISSHEVGLASAQASGDRRAEARMRDQLGFAYLSLHRYPQAQEQFTEACRLAAQARHRLGEAAPMEHLGLAELAMGHPDEALPYFVQVRETYEDLGRVRGAALAARHIGEAHRDAGRYAEAAHALAEARRIFAALPDPYNEARTMTSLAGTHILAGRPRDAAGLLHQALATMTSRGARDKQAGIHVLLADAAELLGDSTRAHDQLERALALYADLGAPEAGQVRLRLAGRDPAEDQQVMRSEHDTAPP
jgi:tetratricopeptide (TPR) repeat protein